MNHASGAVSPKLRSGISRAPISSTPSRRALRLGAALCFALGAQAAVAAPYGYFTNYVDSTVSVIDLSTLASVALTDSSGDSLTAIPVDAEPIGIVLNPAGTYAYVANYGSNTVSVIDTSINQVTADIAVGQEPEMLAISADGSTLYVTALLDNALAVVDTASATQTTEIALGGYPVGVALSPDNTKAYVALADKDQVAVVDTTNNTVATTIPVGVNPTGIVVNAAGTYAYVANQLSQYDNGTVSVIDLTANAVVATIQVGYSPVGLALTPDGSRLYVANNYNGNNYDGVTYTGTVSVVDTASNTVMATVSVGSNPVGISIDSTGTYAYVSNSDLTDTSVGNVSVSSVSVIDLSTNLVYSNFLAGTGPGYSAITSSAGLSVNPDQHGLTGAWDNTTTSGQGFLLETSPDVIGPGQGTLSGGWFTYDVTAAGGQRWYTVSGQTNSASPITSLGIYTTNGGNFASGPVADSVQVGTGSIEFIDCTHGIFQYNFTDGSGRSGFMNLTRLTLNTTCTPQGDSGSAGDFLLSGSWYDPATSGQGLLFDINPAASILSAAWFTYAPNGLSSGAAGQNWYTLQSASFTPGLTSLSGVPIYETAGGVFFDPTAPTTTQVGTATVTFSSCNAVSVAYSFTGGANQGLSGTLNLTRVAPTPAGCSL